jgi:aspartate/methionine/tyrosine aminotransferase
MRERYAARRQLLDSGLRVLGFGVPWIPAGAFYVLADARFLDSDCMRLSLELLERAHVAVAPGRDFGELAAGHLRFSYAAGEDVIAQALERIARFVAERTQRA